MTIRMIHASRNSESDQNEDEIEAPLRDSGCSDSNEDTQGDTIFMLEAEREDSLSEDPNDAVEPWRPQPLPEGMNCDRRPLWEPLVFASITLWARITRRGARLLSSTVKAIEA